jgi:lipoic acid synthetase
MSASGTRKPDWLKVRPPQPRAFRATGQLIEDLALHTVCDEARCPNKGECFSAGTATFLILGDACTRDCGFCAVGSGTADAPASAGRPAPVDADEPRRVAVAARRLGLTHVVVTSVTRDDLPDGGAGQFAATVGALRTGSPPVTIEVLVPDFGGSEAALATVLAAGPDVLNHNLETALRLYASVRPQAEYARSLELLRRAAVWARSAERERAAAAAPPRTHDRAGPAAASRAPLTRPLVKTGLMVGLGETDDEVDAVLGDCVAAGVDLVTIGQYLQPAAGCLPVARFVTPARFLEWERRGADLGLRLRAAPFVRSSYRAGELL